MSRILTPKNIWLLLLSGSLLLEVAALYFQYVLDYGPCILCVQIRALLLGVALLALLALVAPASRTATSVLLIPLSLTFAWLCYQVLSIERGWFEGSCTFEPPFPQWLPLHEWLPSVFEPWELCGYTPEILLGITMAEMLIAIAAIYLAINLFLLAKIRSL